MITMDLPWPPSLNTYYRHVGSRILISRAGRQYRDCVVRLLRPLLRAPLAGRLLVTIHASPPDRRRRDLDNTQKALLDALQHAGVFLDDSQIDDLRVIRCAEAPGGFVRVEIHETAQETLPPA